MSKKYQEDENLYTQIKNKNELVTKRLFTELKTPFKLFLLKSYYLSEEQIWDIYCDAFTIFCMNIREGKLELPLNSSLKTYFFGIGKMFVLKHYEKVKRKKEDPYEEDNQVFQQDLQPSILEVYEIDWQKKLIKKLLEKVGDSCKKILILSFIEENSDEAIANKMNIASSGAVRQKRFTCLEKLRTLVRRQRFS